MAFHPRLKGVLARLDSREKGIVIWDGGYKTFAVSDIPTSWVYLNDAATRIKRTDTIGYSHGVNVIAVEFQQRNRHKLRALTNEPAILENARTA